MIGLVVLSLCLASCLAAPSIGLVAPSIGYSYSAPALSYAYTGAPAIPLAYGYSKPLLPWKSALLNLGYDASPYASPLAAAPLAAAPLYASTAYLPPHSAPLALPVLESKSQYHTQNILGQASYGHSESLQSHNAIQDEAGNKVGSFSYVKPDGNIHRTDYIADAGGYRVASNDLPVGPATSPHAIGKRSVAWSPPIINGHVAETPEVQAAKAAHFAEHAKRGNYHIAPINYQTPHYQQQQWAAPVSITPDGYLADTPEVAAAKIAHLSEKAKILSAEQQSSAYAYNPYINAAVQPAPISLTYTTGKQIIPNGYWNQPQPWYSAPVAHAKWAPEPIITPSGHLAETPEVAQARAAHLAEHAAIAGRHKRSIIWGQTPADTVPLGAPIPLPKIEYAAPEPIAHTLIAHEAISPLAYSGYTGWPSVSHSTVLHGTHAISYQNQILH